MAALHYASTQRCTPARGTVEALTEILPAPAPSARPVHIAHSRTAIAHSWPVLVQVGACGQVKDAWPKASDPCPCAMSSIGFTLETCCAVSRSSPSKTVPRSTWSACRACTTSEKTRTVPYMFAYMFFATADVHLRRARQARYPLRRPVWRGSDGDHADGSSVERERSRTIHRLLADMKDLLSVASLASDDGRDLTATYWPVCCVVTTQRRKSVRKERERFSEAGHAWVRRDALSALSAPERGTQIWPHESERRRALDERAG
jgi:hypothetical protein